MNYIYPDTLDQLTSKMISQLEPYPGYWESSERIILDRILANLKEVHGVMLDAGCGNGRLLSEFAGLFGSIVATDADSSRLADAEQLAEKQGISDKVQFLNISIESLDMVDNIDFALCSHIIQHVNTENVHRVLSSLNKAMKKGAHLALLTNYSTRGNDYFFKTLIKDGNVSEEDISKDDFEQLINNKIDILPVHCFTKKTLVDLLNSHGFTILETSSFHCVGDFGELDQTVHRDLLVNSVPELQSRYGRDVYVYAIKN